MEIFSFLLIIAGLVLFEVVSSIDNAIINAEVLSTMKEKARKWFLFWGILSSVFVVRGALPWFIVWIVNPGLGPIGALTAALSNDPRVVESIEKSAPLLLVGGGIFLVFLFLHWFFVEPKHYGIRGEAFVHRHGVWFYAVVSIFLCVVVYLAIGRDPNLALGAVVGSTAFFIINGFKQNAEVQEKNLMNSGKSDLAKIFYLEAIDATFSIDGVLGAFAFTLIVPLILIGNGIGAIVVRQITVGNIDRIKKYIYLKNGAMYSILVLGIIMLLDAFGMHIPSWLSPVVTFAIVGYFFFKSKRAVNLAGLES